MNLVSSNFPAHWQWLLWLLASALALLIALRANWPVLAERGNQGVFLIAISVVLGLWLIKTGIKPGLNFHLLGATLLTLMFRPLFALLAIALIAGVMALWQGEYAAFAANWLIMGALPVGVSWALYRLVDRKLPNHLFIYIFLNAFLGGALAVTTVGFAATGFVALSGAYTLSYLLSDYLPYYLLMAWSEAFSTGMLMTVLVIYQPEWVATFDDHRYLKNK